MTQAQGIVNNEFDAAKIIAETLAGLDRPQQERALRFASEALGLKAPEASAPAGRQAEHLASVENVREPARALDIKQFTEAKAPQSDQQFAAVTAYYYQFEAPAHARRESIDAELLSEAARLATRKRPSRYALNNAKNAGYLDSAGHGEFRLNTVGENLVAITLPGKAATAGQKAGRQRRQPAGRKASSRKKTKA
ncbi:hypothetical protein [Bradyrhizobium betae]|uniref:Uncharacterized protein n=1 Tax=Bradyrhizobium betae TaxID=244734 RepID=A0A5P6PAL2_9BRAD|nr:hypothetical protein [Bradyrhizobium betae]MCS3726976.1 hypothetical protein [Bradyrhizobium betae]QFI75088.1 hypothetical protein F8237_23390 [Bradyrhizobium betae]